MVKEKREIDIEREIEKKMSGERMRKERERRSK